jgi:hypothetical protein
VGWPPPGLPALRREHVGLSWHTLGGHFRESEAFWAAVGAGVTGGYQKRTYARTFGQADGTGRPISTLRASARQLLDRVVA